MLDNLTQWLTTTIPGLLVLAVIGGLLTLPAHWILKHWVGPFLLWILRWMFVKGPDFITHGLLLDHARYRENGSADRAVAFYAYQVCKLVFGLFVAACTWFNLILMKIFTLDGPPVAVAVVLGLLIVWFMSMAIRAYLTVSLTKYFDEEMIEELIKEAKKKSRRDFDMQKVDPAGPKDKEAS